MGRYTGPKCRLARRVGMNLELKGIRLEAEKSRGLDVMPGGRFQRRKTSPYGERLIEKQKVKYFYGVREKQFRRYFDMAQRMKGATGENLLCLLERRLDNVIFKAGWALTRAQARQMIVHGHFSIGGRRCNVPSRLVDKDTEIKALNRDKTQKLVKDRTEESKGRPQPAWLMSDNDKLTVTVTGLPTRDDVSLPINELLIIEMMSR